MLSTIENLMSNLYNIISDAYRIDIDSGYFILKNFLYFSKTEREAAAITCKRYALIIIAK